MRPTSDGSTFSAKPGTPKVNGLDTSDHLAAVRSGGCRPSNPNLNNPTRLVFLRMP